MRRIALTGNIASGKSTVAGVWREAGAHIVDADALAREAVAPGSDGLDRIVEHFGRDVLHPDGTLDRAAMRRLVFLDPGQRKALEAILHPRIERLREKRDARLEADGVRLVVHVIPLLFEAGLADRFDDIVLVDARESLRRERLLVARGLTGEEADRMIAAQLPTGPKRARATLVIDNDDTIATLERRAAEAWRVLCRRAEACA